MNDDQQALEQEFEASMRRHGIAVPPERRSGVFAGFLELKNLAGLLRQPRDVSAEPSNVFDLRKILRRE